METIRQACGKTVREMTEWERMVRRNIRNGYMVATREELELALERHKTEWERVCIRELLAELD